jgi:hypothetical protein
MSMRPQLLLEASVNANSGLTAPDDEQASRLTPPSLLLLAQRWHEPGVVLPGV